MLHHIAILYRINHANHHSHPLETRYRFPLCATAKRLTPSHLPPRRLAQTRSLRATSASPPGHPRLRSPPSPLPNPATAHPRLHHHPSPRPLPHPNPIRPQTRRLQNDHQPLGTRPPPPKQTRRRPPPQTPASLTA